MPYDMVKPSGQLKSTKPEAGGNDKNVPIIGVVKDNIDPTRSGRIRVSLVTGTGSTAPDDSGSWVTVQQLSPFFGAVGGNGGTDAENYGSYKANPSSYGMWHAPPDIGTQVVCIFINGDPNYGFYIGCIPEPEKLQMVPAIGASDQVTLNSGEASSYGGATRLPVTNLNINNKDKADSAGFLDTPRPVHSYTAAIMSQQGIIRDPVRGPISSSASREAASRVGWGISTPGRPIYSGGYDDSTLPENLNNDNAEQLQVVARRGGHSIVMDDGDIIGRDQLVRIRTALGHQILMSDDGQTLMILHSNGQSYVELGKEGTVDIYSTNSFNVRTHGDINFHADQNINIHASENLNIRAKNIHVESEETSKLRSGKDFQIHSLDKFTVKSESATAIKAGGEASLTAGSSAFITGSKVNLNSGNPGTTPSDVPVITQLAQTDTLFDETIGWAAAPGKLMSVTSRTPAHAPWANAGQGINIKTSGNASDNLPASPSQAVERTTQAGQKTSPVPPAPATVASVPQTPPVSDSLPGATTTTILGATATSAASGSSPTTGATIADDSTGQNKTVVTGVFGQDAQQLANTGILKPGADKLISGLANAGKSISQIMPDSLFTGKAGAENILALASNLGPQAKSIVTGLQQAQTTLTQIGVISGKEDPIQTAGIISAASKLGTPKTLEAIKEQSLATVTGISSSPVIAEIGNGTAAAKFSNELSGLNGLLNSVNSLVGDKASLEQFANSIASTPTAAFDSIKNSFAKLEANTPQNLTKITQDYAESIAKKTFTIPGGNTLGNINMSGTISSISNSVDTVISGVSTIENTISGITGSASTGGITNTINSISSTVDKSVTTLNQIKNAADQIAAQAGAQAALTVGDKSTLSQAAKIVQVGGGAAKASAIASGVNNLPGGLSSICSVIDNLNTQVKIPGTDKLSTILSDAQTKTQNGLNAATSTISELSSLAKTVDSTGILGNKITGASESLNRNLASASESLNGLTSLITSSLDSGNASALMNSVAAATSGGQSPIKIAEIGFNTFSRDSITSQINKALGDPGIPSPNLVGDIQTSTVQTLTDKLEKIKQTRSEIDAKIAEWAKRNKAARDDLVDKINNLPEGDSAITAATNKLNALTREGEDLRKKLDEVVNSGTQTATSLLSGTPGSSIFLRG